MLPSVMDLIALLQRPEGKALEFKRDLSSPDGVLKTIAAFANTAGGTLLIGVEDRPRHVRGVPDALDVEERLANLVSDGIRPRLMPEIEILAWRRTQVLALHVHPSASRPTSCRAKGPRVACTSGSARPIAGPTAS
jgi:predicted HTH transcriptional regulator